MKYLSLVTTVSVLAVTDNKEICTQKISCKPSGTHSCKWFVNNLNDNGVRETDVNQMITTQLAALQTDTKQARAYVK